MLFLMFYNLINFNYHLHCISCYFIVFVLKQLNCVYEWYMKVIYIYSLVIVMWWLRIYNFHDFSINTSTTDSTPLSHPTLSPVPEL